MFQKTLSFIENVSLLPNLKIKNLIFLISIVWIAILLGMWEFIYIFELKSIYVFPIIFDVDALSNFASWQYLSNKIIHGDFLLLNDGESFLINNAVYARLSLIINAVIVGVFGYAISLFIYNIVFPTFCYIFLVKIYNVFLPLRWSIIISAISIMSIAEYPFRNFILSLFEGNVLPSLSVIDQPDIMGQLFPSFSLLIFLILFYFSVLSTRAGGSGHLILSIFWGLQGYIHILNLVFGIPIWLIMLGLFYWRKSNNKKYTQTNFMSFKTFIINSVVVLVLSLPVLIGIAMTNPNPYIDNNFNFDWFTIITYMITPTLLLGICYATFRIDPYELLIKFHLIWVIMFVEIFLLILWSFFGFGVSNSIMDSRLGFHFLHPFYYVPAIYYAQRPYNKFYYGSEANLFASLFRKYFSFSFRTLSIIYLPMIFLLLSIFTILSSINVNNNFKTYIKDDYVETHNSISNLDFKSNEISSSSALELYKMTSLNHRHNWSNSFTDQINNEDAIRGFAKFAHMKSWTLEQFKSFMLPSTTFKIDLPYKIYTNKIIPGLGYWLLTNNHILDENKRLDLENLLERTYILVKSQNFKKGEIK